VSLADGVVLPNPQSWDDALTIDTGFEFKWLNPPTHPDWDYAVRMGYNFSQTPIPDRNFNPLLPDAPVHGLTVGLGAFCQRNGLFGWVFPCGETGSGTFVRSGMGIDLFYMLLLFEPRTVSGHPVPGVNGRYITRNHSGGFTFRINF
jgi:long-chain fatty acid transport protein